MALGGTASPAAAPARPRVKICGVRDREAAEAAIAAGADMIGLVLFPPSPRDVPVAEAAALADAVRGRIAIVALTVDADDALLDAVAARVRPDVLQLHGGEDAPRIAEVGRRFGLPIIKALGVRTAADVARVPDVAAVADRVLLDARPPKGADRPGGHGATFDWSLLDALDPAVPFMLSGGLTPDNVAEAVRRVRPHALDVSSGVERAPGDKDPALIRAFLAATHAAAAEG